ncbi:hypothetical protein [Sphingomonas solaris]|uniref:REDY-like protein HapK n=1 Tax=Alterirhizorhabdus solaris TaxID=2529389 RepID=A0A558RBM4_9SPHN|nr:hypothetical protein [Sphingomonas solaris]TVV76753.1 hypothetical protein FOY91_03345 [Sphingomonas solaris]
MTAETQNGRENAMPRFLLIAINGPTSGEGDEAAYNEWYNKVHAADLMSIDGALSVRRFKIEAQNRIDKPYVNVTEVEGESAEAVMKELAEKASKFPSVIDRTSSVFVLGREITKDA